MQRESQSEVVAFLSALQADAPNGEAQLIQTHISIIVLRGDTVWKLKRALKLPYVDFSTPALREAACRQEVSLNRRTAPTLYEGVRRITREADGRLALDGQGSLVDAVVQMRRFDENTLFSNLAAAGKLDRTLLTELARSIAAFHASAEIVTALKGSDAIETVLTLSEQCAEMVPVFGAPAVDQLWSALRAELDRHRERLDARGRAGRIRRCHGDLHLRNICLVDGRPTLFDCIEFNETISSIDVLYDLAFLLMDLWHAGLRAEANWVMNRYLDESDESDGLPLLAFFMALRASIRAQVLATQAETPGTPDRDATIAEASSYLNLALELLTPADPRLVAVGGLSGSGKSTVAAAIAHCLGTAPGARILASDRIRKKLAGVTAETTLPPEHYTREASRQVYDTLYQRAAGTLAIGHSVIVDAVFSLPEERQRIAQCATRADVPFQGVWLVADPSVLLERVQARRNDPSDATQDVVKAQLERPVGTMDWSTVPTSDGPAATAENVRAMLAIARPCKTL